MTKAGGDPPSPTFASWLPRLRDLCGRLRGAARAGLLAAEGVPGGGDLARPVREGAGDVTFGLDVPTEDVLIAWLDEMARAGPLSLLTEEAGWLHRGPGPSPADPPVALAGFDHGGPRIAIDPIDGTRNLMFDLRPAWTVLGFAGPGAVQPWLRDLEGGIVSELPTSAAARFRSLEAPAGGPCTLAAAALVPDATPGGPLDPARQVAATGAPSAPGSFRRVLRVDADDRVAHGYFPFFRYPPELRRATGEVEAVFFERLVAHEGADLRRCYDDHYLSSGGQLALLALGTYRMAIDLRAWLGPLLGLRPQTAKPYDVSGAVLCARAAGCVVLDLDGGELDFPLDATTPVGFAAYANPATARRLGPHLAAARGAFRPR